MFQYQQQTRSTITTQKSRSKSIRTFGKDITNNFLSTQNSNIDIHYKTQILPTQSHNCIGTGGKRKGDDTVGVRPAWSAWDDVEIMVGEIVHQPIKDHIQDIMDYTLSKSISTHIQQDYMLWHSQLTPQTRQILLNWLIKQSTTLKLQHETLSLCISLIDRYCYKQSILKNKYQLLGITCLFIAAKYEEIYIPKIHKFIQICEGQFNKDDIVKMEYQVLMAIGFEVRGVGVREVLFCRVGDVFGGEDGGEREFGKIEVLNRCQYLLELVMMEYRFVMVPPHYLSAVILYICCKRENIKEVNSKYIIDRYGLSEKLFKDCFQLFITLLRQKNDYKFREVNKKYSFYYNDF